MSKRKYIPGSMPQAKSFAKRLKVVERTVRRNRGEMKFYDTSSSAGTGAAALSYLDLTTCTQGSEANDRIGNKIRLWRVEIRGVADALQDVYVLQAHNGAVPTTSEFTSGDGAFINYQHNNTTHTEWAYVRPNNNQTTNCPIRIIRKFNGMEVGYDGSSAGAVRNRLFLVIRNNSGSTSYHTVSARIWYTDA